MLVLQLVLFGFLPLTAQRRNSALPLLVRLLLLLCRGPVSSRYCLGPEEEWPCLEIPNRKIQFSYG